MLMMTVTSLVYAQDAAKESKSAPVEKSQSLNNTVVQFKPIRVTDQNAAAKSSQRGKSVRPTTKPMQVRVASQIPPLKGNVNNKKK